MEKEQLIELYTNATSTQKTEIFMNVISQLHTAQQGEILRMVADGIKQSKEPMHWKIEALIALLNKRQGKITDETMNSSSITPNTNINVSTITTNNNNNDNGVTDSPLLLPPAMDSCTNANNDNSSSSSNSNNNYSQSLDKFNKEKENLIDEVLHLNDESSSEESDSLSDTNDKDPENENVKDDSSNDDDEDIKKNIKGNYITNNNNNKSSLTSTDGQERGGDKIIILDYEKKRCKLSSLHLLFHIKDRYIVYDALGRNFVFGMKNAETLWGLANGGHKSLVDVDLLRPPVEGLSREPTQDEAMKKLKPYVHAWELDNKKELIEWRGVREKKDIKKLDNDNTTNTKDHDNNNYKEVIIDSDSTRKKRKRKTTTTSSGSTRTGKSKQKKKLRR